MILCCVNRFIQQQSRFILKLFTISSELDDEWNMNHSQAATVCLLLSYFLKTFHPFLAHPKNGLTSKQGFYPSELFFTFHVL